MGKKQPTMPQRARKAGKHMGKKEQARMLRELFEIHATEPLELRRIYRELGLNTHPAKMLCNDILEDMLADDIITQKPKYTFMLKQQGLEMTGTFHRKANGRNTFVSDEGGEPVLVTERNSLHAMDGDRVRACMVARRRHHAREAQIIEIIKRTEKNFVGTLQIRNNIAFLLTEDRTLANDILIPRDKLHGGRDGDKVVAKITEWPDRAKNPVGKVVVVLGKNGENEAEMCAILAEYGLPTSYPKQVEEAANKISADIPESEIKHREDLRDVMTFTIDPRDAKDFDDAISIRRLSPKLWEVGVHIADVTYYVKEDSIIDREALKRATSIYLVDRTIPMLPERLCNQICSLRPDEDKLTYSVIFVIDEKGEIKDWRLAHTVTRSNRRFIYEEVQQLLEAHGEASPEDLCHPTDHVHPEQSHYEPAEHFAQELITLNRIAKALRAKRFAHGAVDFDRCETRFEIDDKGCPLNVYFKVAKDANKLVEEFMLLANRTVAESIGRVPKNKNAKTFVYRVHDQPDPNKLMNLSDFVVKFGHKLRTGGSKAEISKHLNKLLSDVKGKPEQNVVETVTLRAMMKARYSTVNLGHYGLAFEYYTHFTSPIRRYPDMMVHRLLSRYAQGGRSAMKAKYEELCEHSSEMEQLAAQAERASIKYKQVEFMQGHLGEEYEGTISGVTEYGLYVEINENKCEGMVPLRELDDDYYEFDEKTYSLWGRRHHHRYCLGDQVRIRVARANLDRKQLDFVLLDEETRKHR